MRGGERRNPEWAVLSPTPVQYLSVFVLKSKDPSYSKDFNRFVQDN